MYVEQLPKLKNLDLVLLVVDYSVNDASMMWDGKAAINKLEHGMEWLIR